MGNALTAIFMLSAIFVLSRETEHWKFVVPSLGRYASSPYARELQTLAHLGSMMSSLQPWRHSELLAAFSLTTDLANGHAMETALRTCLMGYTLASHLDVDESACSDIFYACLLRYLGCTAFAHEEAEAFGGDDVRFRKLFNPIDATDTRSLVSAAFEQFSEKSKLAQGTSVAKALIQSKSFQEGHKAAHCASGELLSKRLGMSQGVSLALTETFERYDGKGGPRRLRGDEISLVARVLHLATAAELIRQEKGEAACLHMLQHRSGAHFDPALVSAFIEHSSEIFSLLAASSVWDTVLRCPPAENEFHCGALQVFQAFADYVDIKSVYTIGYSREVARNAHAAAAAAKLDIDVQTRLEIAGLLHGLGRVTIPNSILEKEEDSLSPAEWDRVHLYPVFTEQILGKSQHTKEYAELCSAAHEKLDGSGYPKRRNSAQLTLEMRILAAAVVYQALIAKRPYRQALSGEEARKCMQAEVDSGRLCHDAVCAVLEGQGQDGLEMKRPADLSEREVDVLRLIAAAQSNKEIASSLNISAKTVQHHIASIYRKADISTRVEAALFAIEKDLLRS